MVQKHLSAHLLDYLDGYCKRQSKDCPLSACVDDQECQSSRLSLELVANRDSDPEFASFRRSVRDLRCQQCTLILILQAIQRNVPSRFQREWMDKPMIDLDGRTPRQCLDARRIRCS